METLDQKVVSRRRPLWHRVLFYLSIGYVTWCTFLYFYQEHLIFPGAFIKPPAARHVDPHTMVMSLDLPGGGQVESWFQPAPTASATHPGPAVIFFHGNRELIDYQDAVTLGYHQLGYSVLLPEFRGFGRSAGRPSQEGINDDAIQFYDWLRTRPEVDPARIIFHGRSLGGGFAAQLALKRRPVALILESTFTSVAQMSYKYFAPQFLVKYPLGTDEVIPQLACPLLIFHGSTDTIVPIQHARRLHELVPNAVCIEYPCGHNDLPGPDNERDYWEKIQIFLSHAPAVK